MNDITVGLGERSYAVRIEARLLARAGAAIAEVARNRRIAVVGDENVSAHVDTLLASLADAGFEGTAILLPAGEAAKSWATLEVLVRPTAWPISRMLGGNPRCSMARLMVCSTLS